MKSSVIRIVRSGRGAAPVASMTVTCVTARIFRRSLRGGEIWQQHGQRPRPTIQSHAETLVNEPRKVTRTGLLRRVGKLYRQARARIYRQARARCMAK